MDDRICFFVSKLFCGTSSFEALSFKMNAFKDFLESTTIHGLIYISTSRSTLGKLAWSSFVLARFSLAAYLISSSYMEMQESPISTSISTHSTSSPCQSCKKSSFDCTTIGTLKIFCSNLHIFSDCSQKVSLGRFVNLSRHNVIFTHHTVNKHVNRSNRT